MALTPIFVWSLQSPNGTVWRPSLTVSGRLFFEPGGAILTGTPPVFQGSPASVIWTPSIDNDGDITLTQGVAAGQLQAAINDRQLVAYLFNVDADEKVYIASTDTERKFWLKR